MIKALAPKGGKIAILHYKEAESCLQRVKGFREVIKRHNKKHPDRRIEIATVLPSGGVQDEGFTAAQDALQTHPDIRGIFAINDPSALGAYAALENAGKADQVQIVGFDGQPMGKEAIREGKIYADPVQFPEKIGRKTVRTFIRYLNGEDVPKEQRIPTELYTRADAKEEAPSGDEGQTDKSDAASK